MIETPLFHGCTIFNPPGWSWVHRQKMLLLRHLSGWVSDSDCWVPRENDTPTMCHESTFFSHPVDLECIGEWYSAFSTYPVAPKIQSGQCLEEVMERRVCDESRLLISRRWPWAHRQVMLLLQHLSCCVVDPKRRVSRGSDGDETVWWRQMLDLTWLILSASASALAPSAFIRLICRSRVVSF